MKQNEPVGKVLVAEIDGVQIDSVLWTKGVPEDDTLLFASPPDSFTEEQVKEISTEFFSWWWNQGGTNTPQGFDEFWKLQGGRWKS